MNYGLYLSASGLKAQMTQQAVIANNLANAQTIGFKRDLVTMRSRLNATREDPKMFQYRLPVVENQGGGVYASNEGIDMTEGTFQSSAKDTDMAIDGPGFFTVAGDNGEKLLTRDGRFKLDPSGKLVTEAGGKPVLDNDGEQISLNPDLPITVTNDGQVTQGDGSGVKLGIVNVSDPRRIAKVGANLMKADPAAITPVGSDTQVLQHQLESSGVDPMVEIVNMMEGQRVFDANAKMITFQDQTMTQINTVGRVA